MAVGHGALLAAALWAKCVGGRSRQVPCGRQPPPCERASALQVATAALQAAAALKCPAGHSRGGFCPQFGLV
ncbi:hypothetical protein R1flu_020051 [Riccia fluitans]|uniref:Uncharacterized protein n=1 Tax=Riccia fluitans TaxID=41844 RepID=A0ABD1ZKF7_9MARC